MFNLTQPKIMNIRVSNQLTDREAARILREADRTTRRASTSSERARAESAKSKATVMDCQTLVQTFEEAQESFDQAMEERLELEQQIEQHERELALAAVDEQMNNKTIEFELRKKRRMLINTNRRLNDTNRVLEAKVAENERRQLAQVAYELNAQRNTLENKYKHHDELKLRNFKLF